MPMTFTDDLVEIRLKDFKLNTSGTLSEKRERLASHIETKYQDHLEAWEIRAGKPWDEMTQSEGLTLIENRPTLANNAGVRSVLSKVELRRVDP